MTDRELMQMALDALLRVWHSERNIKHSEAIDALRARLAQPEQPQIVWIDNKQTGNFLNMAMPQREWQGLTDEEIESTVDEIAIDAEDKVLYPMGSFARAIEAKLKEKNT